MVELELSEQHARYLEDKRKIPCELAAQMGIVSKGENIAFEYRRNGKLLWRQIRIEEPEGGKRFLTLVPDGRTLKEAGVPLSWWNEDELLDTSMPEAPRIITEGQYDAATFKLVGCTHVGSVPNGAGTKRSEQVIHPEADGGFTYLWELVSNRWQPRGGLATARKIILATDGDKDGLALREELAVRLGTTRCWFVTYPEGCKDANEVLVKYGEEAVTDLIADAKPLVPNTLVTFADIQDIEGPRYSTGWGGLDRHLMICPPQLIIVTGRANDGKSLWTLALVANLARIHGMKGAILQFEDNPQRNRRDLLKYASAWGRDPRGGIDDPKAWVNRMFRIIAPLEDLSEDADYTLKWLETAVEEAAARHDCKWVLIDPWNEVEHAWSKQDTEATYLNRALRHLKKLSRRYRIAIIVVTHPTKEVIRHTSVKEFTLYDINGGAVWRNKADLGIIVWADNKAQLERDIKVDKSKDFHRMGIPGTVTMRFVPESATFVIV